MDLALWLKSREPAAGFGLLKLQHLALERRAMAMVETQNVSLKRTPRLVIERWVTAFA